MKYLTKILFVFMLIFSIKALVVGQVVTTDKTDYEPDENMIITGQGFESDEELRIRILDLDRSSIVHEQIIVADNLGNFTFNWKNPPLLNPENVLYHAAVEVVGLSSNLSAIAYFTDGVPTRIRTTTMGPSSGVCNSTINCYATLEYKISNPDNWGPLPGRTINFTLGSASGSGVTNSSGVATAPIVVPQGATSLVASFAGGGGYNPVTSSIPFTVTGICATPPIITCPADITVGNIAGQCGANVNFSATATGNPTPTITYSHNPGSFFPVGTTTVTAIATNIAGSDTCWFDITVNDNQNPTITCPNNINVNNDPGVCGAIVNYEVIYADNCPGATLTQTAGLASGSLFPIGTTTNTFVVTDVAGNSATCSFDVTVVDNENPTITCPEDINVNNDPGVCGAIVNYEVTFADNCPGATLTQTAGLASGSLFPVGTTTNTFVVTDEVGNSTTCSFDVTVRDVEAPIVTAPEPVVFPICGPFDLGSATAVDNCDGTLTPTNNAPITFPLGQTIVTWSATDAAGNTGTATQTVTVNYGIVDGFLPPLAPAPTAINIKKGRTVPVKFRLTQCPGISNVIANISVDEGTGTSDVTNPLDVVGTSAADIGTLFRYSASDDQYIFNLNTNNMAVGKTYRIRAILADGQIIYGFIRVTR